eukprot:762593-Hanusia_phi.AAC.1
MYHGMIVQLGKVKIHSALLTDSGIISGPLRIITDMIGVRPARTPRALSAPGAACHDCGAPGRSAAHCGTEPEVARRNRERRSTELARFNVSPPARPPRSAAAARPPRGPQPELLASESGMMNPSRGTAAAAGPPPSRRSEPGPGSE